MPGMHFDFDELDATILRWIVEHFESSGDNFDEQDLSAAIGRQREEVRERLMRFLRFQMISPLDRGGRWEVDQQLFSVVEQLSASPEQPDRIERAQQWFRRQWWSVPIWIVFSLIPLVLLPAIVGWVTIVSYLLSLTSQAP